MLFIIGLLLIIIILLLLAYRSPTTDFDPVMGWQKLQKLWSVRIAALELFMASLVPDLQNLYDALPQINTIAALHSVTSSPTYQTVTGVVLPVLLILARNTRQKVT